MNEQRARLAAKEITADLDEGMQVPLAVAAIVKEIFTDGKWKVPNLRDHFLPEARAALARNPHIDGGCVVVSLEEDEEGGWVPYLSFNAMLRQRIDHIDLAITVG